MRAGRKHTTEIRRTPARSLRAGITSKVRRVTACGLMMLCALALVGGIGAQTAWADDAQDAGITVNLHDYTDSGYSNINSGHTLQFNIDNWRNEKYNRWTGDNGSAGMGGNDGAYQNIVRRNLADGYPTLAVGDRESLGYLFDSNTNFGTHNWADVSGLFGSQDNDGYWTYDSDQTSATFNRNLETITRGHTGNGGFWPFGVDQYYFGMDITTDFLMPKDGKVDGEDMIFEFSGDDDVWVFIDDMLVLDIGGIHGAVGGSINFATGEVTVNKVFDGKRKDDNPQNTTLLEMMRQALSEKYGNNSPQVNEELQSLFKADEDGNLTSVLKDYDTHTLKFYYLERGAGESNCKIRFNLQTIPKGTITVGKTVESNASDFVNADFTMLVQLGKDSNGDDFVRYQGDYTVYDDPSLSDNSIVRQGYTTDGTVSIKHGQYVRFTGTSENAAPGQDMSRTTEIDDSMYYRLTETGAANYDKDYEFDISNTEIVDDEEGSIQGTIGRTRIIRVDENRWLQVLNEFTAADRYSLAIQKKMSSGSSTDKFTVKVESANGNPYKGEYGVRKIGEAGNGETRTTDDGQLTLMAGQEALIIDLPLGAEFKIHEISYDEGVYQTPTYEVNGSPVKGDSATITIDHSDNATTYKATVINSYQVRPLEYSEYFSIYKELENHDLAANQFSFTVTPVDQASAEKASIKLDGLSYTNDGVGVQNSNHLARAHARDAKALTFDKTDVGKTYRYVYTEDALTSEQLQQGYTGDTMAYRVTLKPELTSDSTAIQVTAMVERCAQYNDEPTSEDNIWIFVEEHVATSGEADKNEYSITFHNEYRPLGLQVVKVDGDETTTRLSGACFTLKDSDGSSVQAYKDSDPSDDNKIEGEAATNADGILYFFGLEDGTYTLTETKAPSGYQGYDVADLPTFSIKVEDGKAYLLDEDGNRIGDYFEQARVSGDPDDEKSDPIDRCLYIQVSNTKTPDLPTSGSSGTVILGAVGVAAVTVAAAYLASRKGMLPR